MTSGFFSLGGVISPGRKWSSKAIAAAVAAPSGDSLSPFTPSQPFTPSTQAERDAIAAAVAAPSGASPSTQAERGSGQSQDLLRPLLRHPLGFKRQNEIRGVGPESASATRERKAKNGAGRSRSEDRGRGATPEAESFMVRSRSRSMEPQQSDRSTSPEDEDNFISIECRWISGELISGMRRRRKEFRLRELFNHMKDRLNMPMDQLKLVINKECFDHTTHRMNEDLLSICNMPHEADLQGIQVKVVYMNQHARP
jgi:hypothetical protein